MRFPRNQIANLFVGIKTGPFPEGKLQINLTGLVR
jgi:hypothetical protein